MHIINDKIFAYICIFAYIFFRYKGPYRQKVFGPCLDRLHSKFKDEQQSFLADRKGFGRALTGDSATIMGTKFCNFLVHEFGKGVMLLNIHDCTARLQEAGTIDATWIGHLMIKAIRSYTFFFIYILHFQTIFCMWIDVLVQNESIWW